MTANPLADVDAQRHAGIVPWRTLNESDYVVNVTTMGKARHDEILDRLQRFGVCLIRWEAEPPSQGRIESFEQWLGAIRTEQNDFSGKVKTIAPEQHIAATTGDSAKELGPHVDGTQDEETPALLVFQYEFAPTFGGQSTFVDMAAILAELPGDRLDWILKSLARGDCGTCTKTKERPDQPPWTKTFHGPLVKPVCGGRSVAIRFRDSLLTVTEDCQAAFDELKNAIATWPYKLSYMPRDGDIVVFDNWRVLHGRLAVGGRHQRLHDRMWIDRLLAEHDPRHVLGVRPLGSKLMAAVETANAVRIVPA